MYDWTFLIWQTYVSNYLPEVFNSHRDYMLFSNVHDTFIGVNFSPRTQNLYILTIWLFCRYHVIWNGLLKD